jgi:hypothetical protein
MVVIIEGGAPEFHLRAFFCDEFMIAVVLGCNILKLLFFTVSEFVWDGGGVFGEVEVGSVFG